MKKAIALLLALSLLVVLLPSDLGNIQAYAASSRTISSNGINLIKGFEGVRATAYKALATEQYYTIGYGHYGKDVQQGMVITKEEGEQLLRQDIVKHCNYVNTFLNKYNISVNQNQFDALSSFTYNMGNVWAVKDTFRLKTILINGASKYSEDEIYAAFLDWNRSNGVVISGLTSRRRAEAALFLKGFNSSSQVKPTPRYTPDPSAYKTSYQRELYVTGGTYMRGADVKYMQVCLYYLGYLIDTDGIFGANSQAVVKRFQSHYGLNADGRCNASTWNAIEKAVANNPNPNAKKKYTVAYNANGGNGAPAAQTKTQGTALTLSSTKPTRSGYTFLGWSTNKNATSAQYSSGGKFTSDSNTTLYAVWQKNNANTSVSSISIKSVPNAKTYFAGDTLSTNGLKLTVKYSNGSTQEVTSGFSCSPTKLEPAGVRTITVSYGGKTATFQVNVNKKPASAAVQTKPSKLTYTVGDTLNTSGLKLKVVNADGTTKEVTSGFTCSPTALNTAGKQKITVNYGGKTTSFEVQVNQKTTTTTTVNETKPTPRRNLNVSLYRTGYRRVLKAPSMNGNDVKYMQACLYYLGYDVTIDGWYDSGTAAAVKLFQSHYGLSADGQCGSVTWAALEKTVTTA